MALDRRESGEVAERIDLREWRERAQKFETEVSKAVVGQQRVIRLLTIALFARGHVLLEGDVGVGKTTLLRAAARCVGGAYERIEGTIDLMPGDFIYHTYLAEDGRPRVEEGPVLRAGEDLAIFFFNEINRARPQVHSLLLRIMAERSVSAFNREFHFPHLVVFADRNRVEREETFELPAAARDRFLMEIAIGLPADDATRRALAFDTRYHDGDRLIGQLEQGILKHDLLNDVGRAIQNETKTSDVLERYVLSLWEAVRNPKAAGIDIDGVDTARLVAAGASPRGLSYLVRAARVAAWLDGRSAALPEDVRDVFFETMAHRIFFEPAYELRRETIVRELIGALFDRIPVP